MEPGIKEAPVLFRNITIEGPIGAPTHSIYSMLCGHLFKTRGWCGITSVVSSKLYSPIEAVRSQALSLSIARASSIPKDRVVLKGGCLSVIASMINAPRNLVDKFEHKIINLFRKEDLVVLVLPSISSCLTAYKANKGSIEYRQVLASYSNLVYSTRLVSQSTSLAVLNEKTIGSNVFSPVRLSMTIVKILTGSLPVVNPAQS